VVIGGPGDDRLVGGERTDCGEGADEASLDDRANAFVRAGCEALAIGSQVDVDLYAPPARRFLVYRHCYCRYARYVATVGEIEVARTVLPRRRTARDEATLSLRLNARGRRLLQARGRLRLSIELDELHEVGYGKSHERVRIELLRIEGQ
jgi:hypothetical protein